MTLFDTAEIYGFGRSERILGEALGARAGRGRRRHQDLPGRTVPAGRPAAVRQQQPAPRRAAHPALPGAPAQPARARLGDHAGVPRPAGRGPDRRRRGLQLLPGPLAGRRCGTRPTGDQQPGRVLPRPRRARSRTSSPSPSGRTGWSSPTARSPRGCSAAGTAADRRPGGMRAVNPLFGTENLRRVEPLLDVLREVADAHQATPAQIALAWLLALPRVVVIPGASSVEQLESNVAAGEIALSAERAGLADRGGAGLRPGLGRADPRRRGAGAAGPLTSARLQRQPGQRGQHDPACRRRRDRQPRAGQAAPTPAPASSTSHGPDSERNRPIRAARERRPSSPAAAGRRACRLAEQHRGDADGQDGQPRDDDGEHVGRMNHRAADAEEPRRASGPAAPPAAGERGGRARR